MRVTLLAAALLVTACDSQPLKTTDDVAQIVRLADVAIRVAQKNSTEAPPTDIHESMRQMNASLDAAREQIDEIVSRVGLAKYRGGGSINPHDLQACIARTVAAAPSMERMPLDTLALDVLKHSLCISRARTYFDTASGVDAASVALAVNVLHPIVLIGEARLGLEGAPELENYRSTTEAIIARLEPQCRGHNAEAEQMSHECAAVAVAKSVERKLAAPALAAQPSALPASEKISGSSNSGRP